MLKQFWGYLEPRYRRQAILTPVFILAEVVMEVLCCFANKLRKIFIQSAKKKRRLKGF